MTGPSQRREMAAKAVELRGVSIALACRAFGVSETCYRYSPLVSEAQHFATQWLWTYNNDRPNMGIGGITPAQKLKMAA